MADDMIYRQAAIGGTTLEESVKALQDVFADHDLEEKGEPMSDLIDRQAAIDAIRKDVMGGLNYESILKHLPSAEPEIVRCKDCIWHDQEQPSTVFYNSFFCKLWQIFCKPDHFCANGTRRRTYE